MFLLPGRGGDNDTDPIRIDNSVVIREDFEALLKHIYGV